MVYKNGRPPTPPSVEPCRVPASVCGSHTMNVELQPHWPWGAQQFLLDEKILLCAVYQC